MKVIGNLMKLIQERARGRRVLYVGVGDETGHISKGARMVRDVAVTWHGIEIDPTVVQENPDWPIQLLDLDHPIETALPDVDLVVITEVLEHLQSPIASLRNLGRLLPGAAIIGSVPNALSIGRIVSAGWSQRLYSIHDGNHLVVYNRQTIRNTLTQAGLCDVHLLAQDPRLFLRPFVAWRPDFAQGLIFEGVFKKH